MLAGWTWSRTVPDSVLNGWEEGGLAVAPTQILGRSDGDCRASRCGEREREEEGEVLEEDERAGGWRRRQFQRGVSMVVKIVEGVDRRGW